MLCIRLQVIAAGFGIKTWPCPRESTQGIIFQNIRYIFSTLVQISYQPFTPKKMLFLKHLTLLSLSLFRYFGVPSSPYEMGKC
jgi:hypothetical protein